MLRGGADGGGSGDDLARWVDGLVEGRRGRLVQQKRERWVWRVEDAGRVVYVKCGAGARRAEVRREALNAATLQRHLLGPDVLASGPCGGAEWFVLAAAPGEPLDRLLLRCAEAERPVVLAAAARVVRRLHGAGFGFPDLTSRHLFVGPRGGWIIDSARLEVHGASAMARTRARDLAALVASLPRVTTTWADRQRLVAMASGFRGEDLDRLRARVGAEVRRLRGRTRWRHAHAEAAPDFLDALRPTAGGADPLTGEALFEALLTGRGMRVVRTLPDRENRTLGRGPEGRPLFFVKRFPPTRRGPSPAMRELDAIEAFQAAEIPVNAAAAWAEDVDRGSAIAVRACDGAPLDDVLRAGVATTVRRRLALRAARIWRRMRERGLRHRDAYACHAFVGGDEPGEDLRLIDLTRAGEAPWPKERWFVKDAAQLWHGCPKPPVTRTDAVRWLREYFRVPRLTREAKRFARRVAAKERTIAARQRRRKTRDVPGIRGSGDPAFAPGDGGR